LGAVEWREECVGRTEWTGTKGERMGLDSGGGNELTRETGGATEFCYGSRGRRDTRQSAREPILMVAIFMKYPLMS
jgi:hypothetical protein